MSIDNVYYGDTLVDKMYLGDFLVWQRQTTPFNILDLFQNSAGVWYDPSDLNSLNQLSSGSNPVVANSTPVGLVFDKSQGVVLSDNLIPDGNFKLGIGDWYASGNGVALTWDEVREAITLTSSRYNGGVNYKFRELITGQTYELTFNIVEDTQGGGGGSSIGVFRSSSASSQIELVWYSRNTPQTVKLVFKADDGDNRLRLQKGGHGSITISRVSLKRVSGNHAIQRDDAKRPTYKTDGTLHWLEYNKFDDALVTILPAMTATTVIATDDGVAINYPVSIAAGDYTLTNNSTLGRDYGRIIIDRELTANEKTKVTAALQAKIA